MNEMAYRLHKSRSGLKGEPMVLDVVAADTAIAPRPEQHPPPQARPQSSTPDTSVPNSRVTTAPPRPLSRLPDSEQPQGEDVN